MNHARDSRTVSVRPRGLIALLLALACLLALGGYARAAEAEPAPAQDAGVAAADGGAGFQPASEVDRGQDARATGEAERAAGEAGPAAGGVGLREIELQELGLLRELPALSTWLKGFALPWRPRPKVEPATPAAPPAPEPAPEPPAPPVVYYSRVLLVGECNIEGGLGPILQKQLEATPGVTVKRSGKRSTGLARPDYYNWPERIRQLKAEFNPDLIVAYWGDNDCQNCVSLKGKCAAPWGKAEAWHAEYARRAAEVVALMQEGGATAVIIGMPNMRPEKFRKGIARVNSALAEGCLQSGGVFIDAWQFNTDAGGAYLSKVEYGGKTATFQGDDGIHFTSHGAKFMAARIHSELKARFEFGEPPQVVADADGAGEGVAVGAGEDEVTTKSEST